MLKISNNKFLGKMPYLYANLLKIFQPHQNSKKMDRKKYLGTIKIKINNQIKVVYYKKMGISYNKL